MLFQYLQSFRCALSTSEDACLHWPCNFPSTHKILKCLIYYILITLLFMHYITAFANISHVRPSSFIYCLYRSDRVRPTLKWDKDSTKTAHIFSGGKADAITYSTCSGLFLLTLFPPLVSPADCFPCRPWVLSSPISVHERRDTLKLISFNR